MTITPGTCARTAPVGERRRTIGSGAGVSGSVFRRQRISELLADGLKRTVEFLRARDFQTGRRCNGAPVCDVRHDPLERD